jgi:hypothetical protein
MSSSLQKKDISSIPRVYLTRADGETSGGKNKSSQLPEADFVMFYTPRQLLSLL